ncbi:hypothetical protein XBI1_2660068 [Xenorhabdus bovienii str. Intermedium]|uniref:Uncharacterized protein n=1 Tax=Xenorhabdus bovienii str. Intermedium TaxID=1379677 RepID=A0A077QJX0_XENBV|nr:hypothetical protein XBI1_2660068 [Xenorhabdus bovienii str. Intermedium]
MLTISEFIPQRSGLAGILIWTVSLLSVIHEKSLLNNYLVNDIIFVICGVINHPTLCLSEYIRNKLEDA